MSASQSGVYNTQQFTDMGAPLVGGRLFTYAFGTTTHKTAYTDHAGAIPHTYSADGLGGQFIALDARGELPAPLYLTGGSYDLALKTAAGATVWTRRADPVWDITSDLSASSGASLVTLETAQGTLVTVEKKLKETESIAVSTSATAAQNDATIAAALAWSAANDGSLTVPKGVYSFSQQIIIPANTSITFAAGTKLKFYGVGAVAFEVRLGAVCHGNGTTLEMMDPLWDGTAFLVNGNGRFAEATAGSTRISGFNLRGNDVSKGKGLSLIATGATDAIAFTWFEGFSFTSFKTAMAVDSGTSGDPAVIGSWHWINSNTFQNFTFMFNQFGLVVSGTHGLPAEITGNQFLNFHMQPGTGVPVHFTGASNNKFTGFIWDWDFGVSGNAIRFDGGAVFNEVHTNIDTSAITGGAGNKCHDLTGGETGQKIFAGPVSIGAGAEFGKSGAAGNYAQINYPDDGASQRFWEFNTAGALRFGLGATPYSGYSLEIMRITDTGSLLVGATTNPTLSRVRLHGEAGKSVAAYRVGSDGFAGVLFENAAGTQAGYITINTASTVYATSSDYRLKTVTGSLAGSGAFIDALKPKQGTWNADGSPFVGFLAHEFAEVSPSSVSGKKDAIDAAGEPVYQAMQASTPEVMANIIAELQSLRKRVGEIEHCLNATSKPQTGA